MPTTTAHCCTGGQHGKHEKAAYLTLIAARVIMAAVIAEEAHSFAMRKARASYRGAIACRDVVEAVLREDHGVGVDNRLPQIGRFALRPYFTEIGTQS